MAIYRIHQAGDPGLDGWDKTSYISGNLIGTIPDNLIGGIVTRKMGTSIPSPFARLFLFDAAFKMVGDNHDGSSAYHKLLSECLDMLEFLFIRGNDPLLTVKRWDRAAELTNLSNSLSPEHKQLGNVLSRVFNTTVSGINEIYLFYYNNQLIGGTSPYTLVFTSPNWEKSVNNAINPHPTGGCGNILFPIDGENYPAEVSTITPLHRRSYDFREYLHKMRIAYNVTLLNQAKTLFDYLVYSFNHLDNNIRNQFTAANTVADFGMPQFLAEYKALNDISGGRVLSSSIPIATFNTAGDGFNLESGYRMRIDASKGIVTPPIALNDVGLTGVNYINGSLWNPQICQITRNPSEPLEQRILPGGAGIVYPYLTDADFLTEKIIQISGTPIDSEKYYTFADEDSRYLLPLRKEYFKYFSLGDLTQNLKISKTADGTVNVELNIPIMDNVGSIPFKKEYKGDTIVKTDLFNFGIMPFYKVNYNQAINDYNFVIGDGNVCNVSVGTFAASMKTIDMPLQKRSDFTTYARLQGNLFDFIEFTWKDGNKAMLIPKMREFNAPGALNYDFCVDFGTSNTHVAYTTDNGHTVTPFKITRTDTQVGLLNKVDISLINNDSSFGFQFGEPRFAACIAREFVPLVIGDNDAKVAYPHRTVMCEIPDFALLTPANRKLFSGASIGYNFHYEINATAQGEYKYISDLKWALEHAAVQTIPLIISRLELYCEQFVLMLKNMVIQNNGNPNFNLTLTFPAAMTVNTKNAIIQCWTSALTSLMLNNVTITEESESIAPYYALYAQVGGNSFMTIDIGGGTTDMLIVTPNCKVYNSSFFAANDLWGDGLTPIPQKNNGFVTMVQDAINNGSIVLDADTRSRYETTVRQTAENSADIVGFLFSNDAIFGFSNMIKVNADLYPLVFLHFSATVYHICQILESKGVDMPRNLALSGMGSKYINLISNQASDIGALISVLYSVFTGRNVPAGFTVHFAASPKELTAEGALTAKSALIPALRINQIGLPPNPASITFDCAYGIKNGKDRYTIADLQDVTLSLKESISNSFDLFIDTIANSSVLVDYLQNQFGVNLSSNSAIIERLREYKEDSIERVIAMKQGMAPHLTINETFFFWALKHSLYELSK